MIKNKIKIGFLALGSVFLILGCSDGDKTIDEIFDTTTSGGILRTLSSEGSLDIFDTTQELKWSIQEQDSEDGGLLDRVEITTRFVEKDTVTAPDLSVGTTALATIPASEFGTTDGLPSFEYSITLEELLSATNLTINQMLPADKFIVDMELFLTDGRSFDRSTASGNVEGGSFFSSPFTYEYVFGEEIVFSTENRGEVPEVSLSKPTKGYDVNLNLVDSTATNYATMNIYREFVDRSIGADGTNLSEEETLLETFAIDAVPGTYALTTEELIGSNLSTDDLVAGDLFRIRYEFVTSDGRVIKINSEGDEFLDLISVTECTILNTDAPVVGEYTINFTGGTEDAGWDGAQISVVIDGGDALTFTLDEKKTGEEKFTVPENSTTLVVSYVAGTGENEQNHAFSITAPNGNSAVNCPAPLVPGAVELFICE